MNLRISDPKIEELAQELANRTGETLEQAVTRALEERILRSKTDAKTRAARLNNPRSEADIAARTAAIMEIVERVKKLPVLDDRTPDEIIGYNEYGHFD